MKKIISFIGKLLKRLAGFPFFAALGVVVMIGGYIGLMYGYIVYGGEFVTHRPKTKDSINKLLRMMEEIKAEQKDSK